MEHQHTQFLVMKNKKECKSTKDGPLDATSIVYSDFLHTNRMFISIKLVKLSGWIRQAPFSSVAFSI